MLVRQVERTLLFHPVLGSVLYAVFVLLIKPLSTMIIPILQMRKLRHSKAK